MIDLLIIDNFISLATCPLPLVTPFRANDQNRTDDLILTMDVLYRLSYIGVVSFEVPLERKTGLEPATPSLEG